MYIPAETRGNAHANSNQPWGIFSRWRVFLRCALIICLPAFCTNYCQPPTTYATAPGDSAAVSAAAGTQERTKGLPAKDMAKLASTPSIWPAKGEVTSSFGWRLSPFGDNNEMHAGIDIASKMGTPVVAAADGQIVQSSLVGDYGNMVQIDHGNGITTIYGHNSELAVSVGQTVHKGQIISYVGSTGRSTGPHLHYEVRKNDAAINPWDYLVSF